MLLNRLRHVLHGRRRGQGLVEYGLITACLAFAGVAGFNALADAQKTYLTTYPKNVPAPVVAPPLYHPTTFIHPTPGFSCNTGVGASNTWSILASGGVPITCWGGAVGDGFTGSPQYAPEGTEQWTFEEWTTGGALVRAATPPPCLLGPPIGISNDCPGTVVFPVAASDVGNIVTVSVNYIPCTVSAQCPVPGGTYHFAAVSKKKSITIAP